MVDPPGASRRAGLVVVSLLAVAAITAGIVLLVTRDDASSTASATSTTAAVAPSSTTATSDPLTPAPTTISPAPAPPAATEAPTTTTDPVAAAQAALTELVQTDQATADTLQNQYVPQLSAKRVGLEIDGVSYGPVEILADHTVRRDAYGAILVDAGRYQFENNGQPMAGWYLTIVPITFPTREAATAWCTDRGLGPDQCFGRIFKPLA